MVAMFNEYVQERDRVVLLKCNSEFDMRKTNIEMSQKLIYCNKVKVIINYF